MRTPLSLLNVLHDKVRSAAVVCGVGFSILLLFMQLGFYDSCRLSATVFYDLLAFDIVLASPAYNYILDAGSVPSRRLEQAAAVPGIEKVSPLHTREIQWKNIESGRSWTALALGVRPPDEPFLDGSLNQRLGLINKPDMCLFDLDSRSQLGARNPGARTEVSGRRMEVAGQYRQGTGFIGGGLIVSEQTMARLGGAEVPRKPTLGLIRISPGVSVDATVEALRRRLPEDVVIWTRPELEARERRFWLWTKPMGLMFGSGVLVAFLVGSLILHQVLVSEVAHRLREFATLSALGYPARDLRRVVVEEAVLFSAFGFLPAYGLATWLYASLREETSLPMFMTGERVATVFALTAIMCAISGVLAVTRVSEADPAELF
jgi:putative ABC transport system permease protein